MALLKVIHREPGLNPTGRTIYRSAVRAIIHQGGRLLMVYSPVNGDYKFPGGGVAPGETPQQALAREALEEAGARLTCIEGAFGYMVEYDRPVEPEFDLFHMTSYYYLCQAEPELSATCLDDYEADLGFCAAWVGVDEAIQRNVEMMAAGRGAWWTPRDTFVLGLVREVVGSRQ